VSRRWSGEWGRRSEPDEPLLEVLIPTVDRPAELTATLAGLAAQDDPPFGVIVSDQSAPAPVWRAPAVAAMVRVLQAQGRPVRLLRRVPRRGLADQRQFLLDASSAPEVLFLDDDVWLEPGTLTRMHEALRALDCGFVGCAVQGLSYLDDERPQQQERFEPWPGVVVPERVRPGTEAFERWPLHNAANLAHIAARLPVERDGWVAYRIAWIGGCVLYDRAALLEAGGFDFGVELPAAHAGEDVAAQWRVMERRGGAGLLPSGAVHLEAPTTVPDRDVDLARLLPRLESRAG